MNHTLSNSVDPLQLRDVLGRFATGIVIVTACSAEGKPVGLTISSFNSLSLNPALVLWSIDLNSSSLETFRASDSFAINILSHEQLALCKQFSRKGVDKFAGIEYSHGISGAPLLDGSAAHIQCKTVQRIPTGDHELYVGQVLSLEAFDSDPLIFHRGAFKAISPLVASAA